MVRDFLDKLSSRYLTAITPARDGYLFTKEDNVPIIKFENKPMFKIYINSRAPVSALLLVSQYLEPFRDVTDPDDIKVTVMAYQPETKTVLVGDQARHYLLLKDLTSSDSAEFN